MTPKGKLTLRQELTVRDIVDNVANNKGFNPKKSMKKFYKPKSEAVLRSMTSEYIQKPKFREAIISGLIKRGIIGNNSLVEQRLKEGLNSEGKDGKGLDRRTILLYIQEINKIAGMYAPVKSSSISLNLTPQQVEDNITRLKKELDT